MSYLGLPVRDNVYLLALRIPPSDLATFAAADARQSFVISDEKFCKEYYNLRVPSDLQLERPPPFLTFCKLIHHIDRVLARTSEIQTAVMRWQLCSTLAVPDHRCEGVNLTVGEDPDWSHILIAPHSDQGNRVWPVTKVNVRYDPPFSAYEPLVTNPGGHVNLVRLRQVEGTLGSEWTVETGDIKGILIGLIATGLSGYPNEPDFDSTRSVSFRIEY